MSSLYMETQLAEENYNNYDSNANPNEITDDDNQENINNVGILERGTVPGAQSTFLSNPPVRPFSNASANNSFYYAGKNINTHDDDEERNEEIIHFTDSDEKSIGQRMVLGCNSNTLPIPRRKSAKLIKNEDNNEEVIRYTDSDEKPIGQRMVLGCNGNTFPGRKNAGKSLKNSKLNKPYLFDTLYNQSKDDPPLEKRMVVGETSDVPAGQISNRSIRDDRQYVHSIDDDKSRRVGNIKDSVGGRYDKSRKKPPYDLSRRDRRKIESDDEDFDESADRAYDNSPDREMRSYHNKHYRSSPRRFDKKMSGRDCESSFTQSQDESYYDDDDDDYDSFRDHRSYYNSRRSHKDPGYRQFNHEPYFRDDRSYRDRRPDYYGRYDEDSYYRDGRNSRPSSRSGSEYRREVIDYTNPRYYSRPPYYEYLDHRYILHYGNGPRMHKREIDYWSKVREMEPQKYMNWFKVTFPKEYGEWYARHVRVQTTSSYQADRRGSGHSGQSSVNNDSISLNEKLLDVREQSLFKPVESELDTSMQEGRCSPLKFAAAHVKGVFNSLGQLIVVNVSSPQDGQTADVDICQILPPEDDPDVVEFINFTGPFIVGETHVNTISDFVRYHADVASSLSEKMLYMLIDLIIKLRGVTDGIAISELLMDNYENNQKSGKNSQKEDSSKQTTFPYSSETEIIEKYTDLLLQGNKNAALEWAVNNKLWGHAFLLASKIGTKHYSNVLAKFDSSIPMNNPLKTLYQLYSNQIPQAATACADEKWGDWRPHLAMILSNPTGDSELDKTSIITLGDSLGYKDVFASHFCYLAAQADFDFPSSSSSKYCLLSLRNSSNNFGVNTCNHAILLTQTYEFAKRLQKKNFILPTLLPFKYLLATRLIDYGKSNIALQYLESIALDLIQNYSDQHENLAYNILELSERIKYSDSKPLVVDLSSEKQWITDLRQIISTNSCTAQLQPSPQNEQQKLNKESAYLDQLHQQSNFSQQRTITPQQLPKQSHQQILSPSDTQHSFIVKPQQINKDLVTPSSSTPVQFIDTHQMQQPWENKQTNNLNTASFDSYNQRNQINVPAKAEMSIKNADNVSQSQANDYDYNNQMSRKETDQNFYSPWDQPQQQPLSISMHSSSNYFDETSKHISKDNKNNLNVESNSRQSTRKEETQTSQSAGKEFEKKDRRIENENSSGWLGGIFGKLAIRPKNQIKLPDDKNPSIVWSDEKKRWVDVNDDDDDENVNNVKPPPKASELKHLQAPVQPNGPNELKVSYSTPSFAVEQNKPPPISSNNMYKIPRGKGMKSNYVNVLSQNTISPAASGVQSPNSAIVDAFASTQVPPNFQLFVPSPVENKSSALFDLSAANSKPLDNASQNCDMHQKTPLFYNPNQYNS